MAKKFVIRKKNAEPTAQLTALLTNGVNGKWFYANGHETHGPLPQAALKTAVADGKLTTDSLVWHADTPVRMKAGMLPWLFTECTVFEDAASELLTAEPLLTCPSCHATFISEDALFIALHPSLPYDLLVGPGHAYRFRPTRFTPEGAAIDPCGAVTTETACPNCHAALAPADAPAPARPAPRDKNAPERLPPQLSTAEGIQKLVAEIQSLLNRTGSARVFGDVNARQYAELIRRASIRLALCQQFIHNGQTGAAFDQIEQPPQLLDLCALLPFPDIGQWGQLCARSRWAVPGVLDADAIAEVQACYHGAPPFEPVFRALRRAVRRKKPEATLRILRALMLMDPDNNAWREDVANFEHVRQLKLFDDAAAAMEAADADALAAPATELAGPWLVPPDAEVLETVASEFARLRAENAAQRGATLAAQFAKACATQNFEDAAAAHEALEKLHTEGLYQPDETAQRQLGNGRIWFARATAERQADAVFADDLAALEEAIGKPDNVAEIRRLRNAIQDTGREAPVELLDKANGIVQRHDLRVNLRRLMVRSAKFAAGVVVLALLGLLCWFMTLAQQRKAYAAQLEQALRAENVPAFDAVINDMSHGLGRLLGAELTQTRAMHTLCLRRNELAARIQNRASVYQTAVSILQQIQANHFEASAKQILALLANGKQAAKTMDEMAALERFEEPWRADQNARIAQALVQLPTLVPPAANVFATQPFAVATQQVAQYCAKVEAAAGLLGANKADLEKVAPFAATAGACHSNLSLRLTALQAADAATNLNAYLDVLVRYTDRYTNDTLSVPLAGILSSRREYRTALNVVAEMRQQSTMIASNTAAWPQARRAMMALSDANTLNNLRWVIRKGTGELFFVLNREKAEPGTHGMWAECYLPQSGDTGPKPIRTRVTDDPPYKQGVSDKPSTIWHHTDIVNAMIAEVVPIDRADNGANFFEAQFRLIGTAPVWSGTGAPGSNDLPNVAFKIQFLVLLAEHLTHLSPLPEWKLIYDELKAADVPQANWICLRSGDVKRINQEGATKALPRIFGPGGLLLRLDVRRSTSAFAARTPLSWAGHVDFGDPTRIHWLTPTPPASFAVLRPDANQVLTIAIDAGAPTQPRLPLIAGEPLLAWSDGVATATKTAEIAALLNIADPATLAPLVPPWYPR